MSESLIRLKNQRVICRLPTTSLILNLLNFQYASSLEPKNLKFDHEALFNPDTFNAALSSHFFLQKE